MHGATAGFIKEHCLCTVVVSGLTLDLGPVWWSCHLLCQPEAGKDSPSALEWEKRRGGKRKTTESGFMFALLRLRGFVGLFFFSYKLAHVGQNHSRFPLYLIPQLLSHYLWTRAIIHLTGLTLPALMRSQIDVYLLFLDCFSLCCQQCSTSSLPSPQKFPLHFSKSLIRSCEILTKVTGFFSISNHLIQMCWLQSCILFVENIFPNFSVFSIS